MRFSPEGVNHMDVVNNQEVALCAVMNSWIQFEERSIHLPATALSLPGQIIRNK